MINYRELTSIQNHPALTGQYRIPTTSILEFMDIIIEWINNRNPGGIVMGQQRHGKSCAIEYITKNLAFQLGSPVSIFSFECKKHQKESENRFFEDMLIKIKHKATSTGSPSKKRARLVEYILEKTQAEKGYMVIIMDEAQKMMLEYYEYLADFHNDIVSAGFSPLFILVGQPELINMKSSLRGAKKSQIIGRFMLREHYFHGLTDLDAVKGATYAYDTQTEYPENSECSYSRYFFPDAYENGWRLSSEAERIKRGFDNARIKNQLSISSDIPMQYFCTSVENFFRKFHDQDNPEFQGTDAIWNELIRKSGYVEAGTEMHKLELADN
ncbi:MAG: ATP-binding protein [Gallionella sp.]|jgi:hypothetical protein